MRYVILRDDDTNALTPIDCLDALYRPFLDRGLPVNLAVIPEVDTKALTPDGVPEGFLFAKNGARARRVPINDHPELVKYLLPLAFAQPRRDDQVTVGGERPAPVRLHGGLDGRRRRA